MNKIKLRVMGLSIALIAFNVSAGEQLVTIAKDAGFTSCLETIDVLENFFTEKIDGNNNYGSRGLWAKEKNNDQIFNATLEITHQDVSQLIDFTVAPTRDGQCSYSYTRTVYFNKSCMVLAKSDLMKNTTYKTELHSRITLFVNEAGTDWILLPAGRSGCVLQKKEVGFRDNAQK